MRLTVCFWGGTGMLFVVYVHQGTTQATMDYSPQLAVADSVSSTASLLQRFTLRRRHPAHTIPRTVLIGCTSTALIKPRAKAYRGSDDSDLTRHRLCAATGTSRLRINRGRCWRRQTFTEQIGLHSRYQCLLSHYPTAVGQYLGDRGTNHHFWRSVRI